MRKLFLTGRIKIAANTIKGLGKIFAYANDKRFQDDTPFPADHEKPGRDLHYILPFRQ